MMKSIPKRGIGAVRLGFALAAGCVFPAPAARVAAWGFGEGSGPTHELVSAVASAASATYLGYGIAAGSSNAIVVAGTAGTAIDTTLDANGISGFGGTAACTVLFTMSTTNTGSKGTCFNYSPNAGNNAGTNLRIYIGSNGLGPNAIRLESSAGAAAEFVPAGITLNNGSPHFVAIILAGGQNFEDIDVYVDGTLFANPFAGLAANNAAMNLAGSGDTIKFGCDYNNALCFNGIIDDVAIYGEALSAAALDALRTGGLSIDGPAPVSPLANAMAQLKKHIDGVAVLTAAQINTHAATINSNRAKMGDSAATMAQAFDLVADYETTKGALFINAATQGGFSRTDTSTVNLALAHALLKVQQALIDDAYHAANLAAYPEVFDGAKFTTSAYFPGAVAPPADPNAVYSVQINASQPEAWGYEVMFRDEPARRPTGAYLAPGSIATVTVPSTLVNQGFQIRVGAHVHDLSAKSTIKRIDRVSLTYPITSTSTKVANPLGGGIYIEVPYKKSKGLVAVQVKNAVRSPFYSNTPARQTTLADWQNTERHHPGPWADFETEKTMFNLPAGWIYNYADPATLMANWDKAMDAVSDLMGMPLVRPKTVLYAQIDVLIKAAAYAPGYPQSNDTYNPAAAVDGNKDHDYLNGPKFANYVHLHELGHACYLTKFTGETEATVNLLYVPVHHRKFGVTLDNAFGRSMGNDGCKTVSRDQAALMWILSDKFRAGNAMADAEMKYQHRGYGKYVEIAGLFGWEALGDFWHSVAVDSMNGIEYPRNSDPADSRILRMSRAAGVDLRPLIHFWGVHPQNAANLKTSIQAEGLLPSALIYDRLKHYQSIVPMNTSQFETHYQAIKNAPREEEWYTAMRTGWTQAMGNTSVSRVQNIIDLYFPNGRPGDGTVQSLPYAESFENGMGAWVQPVTDHFDWTRHSGVTPSTNTGPSAASDGLQYLYLEGDEDGGQYRTALLECPFDLGAADRPELRFDYHMHGFYTGSLSVDIHDGSTWHSNVWTRAGQQHGSYTAPWSNAVVNLSAFASNSAVTVRFRGKTGQWAATDTAIDHISLANIELTPYEQWAQAAFAAAAAGTDRTPAGNPDGDRFGNQLEWALVTDPLIADVPAMSPTISAPNFVISYQRRLNSGFAIGASWSSSLDNPVWRTDGMTEVKVGQVGDVEDMAALVPLDGTQKFVRIGVTQP